MEKNLNTPGMLAQDERQEDTYYFDRTGCLQHAPKTVEVAGRITAEARKESS